MSAILARTNRPISVAMLLAVFGCNGPATTTRSGINTEEAYADGPSRPDQSSAPNAAEDPAASDFANDHRADNPSAAAGLDGSALPTSDRLLVDTRDGKLRGSSSAGVEGFLGIPYAAPPVGMLRLEPTAAVEPWTDVRPATTTGEVCPQWSGSAVIGEEDCLYLNVYRPANSDPSKRLPVMVWIHGGSFKGGNGSEYDPRRLVTTNNIIVVTINYRLGPLGFLAGDGLTGDYGFQDQIAALRWVQANIGAFGGAADQVTIQGESAGGVAVCALLTAPAAAGMFSRAIIQSASCESIPLTTAQYGAPFLAQKLTCSSSPAACAKDTAFTAKQLVSAAEQLGFVYGPVAGSGVLPLGPSDAITQGQLSKVPVLIGDITDEMSFFMVLDSKLLNSLSRGYPQLLADWFPNVDTNAIANEYPLASYGSQPFSALAAALNDSGVYYGQALGGCVTATAAAALSAATATYSYELNDPGFTWTNDGHGASHTTDLPYLFDLQNPLSKPLNATQSSLAQTMLENWGSFITSGRPSQGWPLHSSTGSGAGTTRYFQPGVGLRFIDLRVQHHCVFWDNLCGANRARCPYPKR